jgi:hypothetical protein
MPRKPTDSVIEKRITLGNYERVQIQKIMDRRSAAIALQGGGLLIGGVGALIACYAFSKVKMPDVLDDMKGLVTGPVFSALDTAVDALFPNEPVALRREAQALAKRREELRRNLQIECSLTYENYEREKCVQAQLAWDAYILDREAFQQHVVSLTSTGGPLHHAYGAWWYFIFGRESTGSSLGSINPNLDDDPFNDVPKEEYAPRDTVNNR